MKNDKEIILIIEDDEGLNELLSEKLNDCGYQTMSVFSGKQAYDWLAEQTPFLILLDYGLPDKNGREFISELKSGGNMVPPFILATGQGDERIAVEMMKLGARDYVVKDSHFLEMMPLIVAKVCTEVENENKLKQVEQALGDSESRFKLFMDYIPATVFMKDNEGRTLFVNKYMADVLGASPWLGKNMAEVFPNEFGAKLLADDMKVLKSGYLRIEETVPHLNGELHNYETQKFIIPRTEQEPLLGGLSFDITERKKADEALRISEEKFRSITEQIDEYISICDFEGLILYASPASVPMFHYEPEELTGHHFMEFITSDSLPKAMDTFRNGIMKNIKAINLELNLIRKDGSSFIGELNGTKVIYGNQEWVLVLVRDITERKRVQDALYESEELYRNLVLMIPDGVYKTTAEGKFIDVNPAMVKILGYGTREELMSQNINSLLYFDAPNHETRGNKRQNEEKLILKLNRKDGTDFWVEDHGWYNFDDNGNVVSHEGVLRDITERKLAEDALQEKMDELIRFQRLTVGRELTMIELKKEVNELLKKSGLEEKYIIFE